MALTFPAIFSSFRRCGETNQPFRTLPGMTDPDPFLAVISSSTALLLVAFALATTLL
jgi:hypothetical protein